MVGGGLAGLTAAAELARAGTAVTLFESAKGLGGRASTRDLEGYRFNLGPRALYAAGPGRAVLDDLGVRFTGRAPSLERPLAWIEGQPVPLPVDFWSLLTCRWMGLRERLEAMAFLGRLAKVDTESLQGKSAARWLDECFRQTASRQLIEALLRLTTYSDQPEALDASVAARQLQLAFSAGVLYIDGGWQTLVDELRRIATAAGARIETGRRIVQIEEMLSGGVLCHVADGPPIHAASAVLAVDPTTADRLLDTKSTGTTSSVGYAEACRPVFAGCFDMALKALPRPDRTFVQGIDRPFYISVHSATAELAPEGSALIHALLYLRDDELQGDGRRNDSEGTLRDRVRSELETVMDEFQPGWRDQLVHQQTMPKLRVCHDLPSPTRPRVAARIGHRIAVAGDWVGPEILADAAITSGRDAARALISLQSKQPVGLAA